MVKDYIKSLLFEQDQVVIPEFGGLTLYYEDPRLDQQGALQPAAKRITFDEKQKYSDSNLAAYVAHHQDIEERDAAELVRGFVFDARREMQQNGYFHFEGIGKFTIDNRYNLEFEQDQDANFLADSFGLPSVKAELVEHDDAPGAATAARAEAKAKKKAKDPITTAAETPAKEKSGRGTLILVLAMVLLVGGSIAIYYLVQNRKHHAELAQQQVTNEAAADEATGENPGDEPTEAELEADEAEASATPSNGKTGTPAAQGVIAAGVKPDKKAAAKPAGPAAKPAEPAASTAAPAAAGTKAYVIAGSFPAREKAEKLVGELKARGLKAQLLEPFDGSPNYRVSAQTYKDKQAAQAAMPFLKAKTKNESLWVMVR